jgi:hypothetical protein
MGGTTPALDKLPEPKELLRLMQEGMTQRQIMERFGATRSTVSRACIHALSLHGNIADTALFRMRQKTMLQRFWARVAPCPDTGCWLWNGAHNGRYATLGGGRGFAHRFAYEQFVGPIEPGMVIDHKCRNTMCVNPNHLQQVTPSINIRLAHVRNLAPVASADS